MLDPVSFPQWDCLPERKYKEKKCPIEECQCYNCSLLLSSQEKGRLDSSIRFLEAVDLSHPVPVWKKIGEYLISMDRSQCLLCSVTGDDFHYRKKHDFKSKD